MVTTLVNLMLLAYGLLLFTACFSVWRYVFRRLRQGQPILEQRAAPTVRWGLADVLGGTILFIGIASMLQMLLMDMVSDGSFQVGDLTLEERVAAIWGMVLGEMIVFVLLYLAIGLRGGSRQIFGQSASRFMDDVRIGVLAFCALCIPVLFIQMLAAYLIPYEHPLIDLLIESPEAWILVPVVFSAVIAAPLFEEFAFRLVLQGWLEDWFQHRLRGADEVLLGRIGKPTSVEPDRVMHDEPLVPILDEAQPLTAELQDGEADNPYASPPVPSPAEPSEWGDLDNIHSKFDNVASWRVWLPTLVSAAVFALLHFGQGAAPIPLFFLALGLGYVFRKTRTLTATLVVHFLLNGQSMLFLLVQIFLGDSLPAEVP